MFQLLVHSNSLDKYTNRPSPSLIRTIKSHRRKEDKCPGKKGTKQRVMMSSVAQGMVKMFNPMANGRRHEGRKQQKQTQLQGKDRCGSHFQMPLHYPSYTRAEYEAMPEWKLDCLLREYGLPVAGDLSYKRKFAMGAFLWPSQV